MACAGRLCLGLLFLGTAGHLAAQVTKEGEITVFRGGAGEVLLTDAASLELPVLERDPVLHFTVGFSTQEEEIPGSFLDSFTVTLEAADPGATAVLLTLDRSGVLWRPSTPGGILIEPEALSTTPSAFAGGVPTFDYQSAYSVAYALPAALAGGPATIYFDLFDNLDGRLSAAYVTDLRVESIPGAGPTQVSLLSAPRLAGPFVVETRAAVDLTNHVVVLGDDLGSRFFRLRADRPLRIHAFEVEGGEWALGYHYAPEVFVLEGAQEVTGPYEEVPEAVVDGPTQTIRLPEPAGATFFRVRSEAPVELVAWERDADAWVVRWTVATTIGGVLVASRVTDPFVEAGCFRVDDGNRQVRVPWSEPMRFFRLQADAPVRLTGIRREAGRWVIDFE